MKLKSFIAAISSALALLASTAMVGFSLIELLVVVAIIGILAAIGTVGYNNYIIHTKNAVVLANANAIAEALKVCDAANNCTNPEAPWAAGDVAQAANMSNPILNTAILEQVITCYASCSVLGAIDICMSERPDGNFLVVSACNYNGYNQLNPDASTKDPNSPAPFKVNHLVAGSGAKC
jgi:type IV pilus assembly protein PilA